MYCIIQIEKVRYLINGSSIDMFYILHFKWCVCVCVCKCVDFPSYHRYICRRRDSKDKRSTKNSFFWKNCSPFHACIYAFRSLFFHLCLRGMPVSPVTLSLLDEAGLGQIPHFSIYLRECQSVEFCFMLHEHTL